MTVETLPKACGTGNPPPPAFQGGSVQKLILIQRITPLSNVRPSESMASNVTPDGDTVNIR